MLLDTGVVFAALNQAHASHLRVSRWLGNRGTYATCGLTQIGAFRLLLTDAAMNGAPLSQEEAHEVIAEFANSHRHRLLPCPPIAPDFVGKTNGSNAAFDDYLVQIASAGQTKLATLDTRLGTRWRDHTHVIR